MIPSYIRLHTTHKMINNMWYGMFACTYSLLYNAAIAKTITQRGREIIQRVYDYLHVVHGKEPIYCDTDSVFIHVSSTEIEAILKSVNRFIYPYRMKIEFSFDKLYIKCIKSYCGFNLNDGINTANGGNIVECNDDKQHLNYRHIVLKGIFNTFYNQPLCCRWFIPQAVRLFLYSKTRGIDIMASFTRSSDISTFKSMDTYSDNGPIWFDCKYEEIVRLIANESARLNTFIMNDKH